MEGITHPPMRALMAARGGVGIVCTEFVRVTSNPLGNKMLRKHVVTTPHARLSVQVMGNDIAQMADATALVTQAGADIVDINLGCPAPRVVRKGVGSAMLKDLGVQVVLTGHSERRHEIGETDVLVNAKTRAALDAGLEVILCVGEKLEQRDAGQTDAINAGQTHYGLAGVKAEQMGRVTIAYEPVWAIGTGKTPTEADAQAAHAAMRNDTFETAFSGSASSPGPTRSQ
jgi:hypothetical protein